jgi:hypothetical protein
MPAEFRRSGLCRIDKAWSSARQASFAEPGGQQIICDPVIDLMQNGALDKPRHARIVIIIVVSHSAE